MKLRFLNALICAIVLTGCSYSNKVVVEIQTDAKGRLASARVLNPSEDKAFNEDALIAAKRRFPIRVPDAKPDHTYHQPVNITYPLFKADD